MNQLTCDSYPWIVEIKSLVVVMVVGISESFFNRIKINNINLYCQNPLLVFTASYQKFFLFNNK